MFGPEGYGGIRGQDGDITAVGGALVAKIAHWTIRRSGTHRDGTPELRFRAHFSWRNEVLMKMCQNGTMKGRVRVYMHTTKGNEQVDVVNWHEWRVDEDGVLILEDILHFDTAPIK